MRETEPAGPPTSRAELTPESTALRLAIVAAVASLVLVAVALVVHAAGGPAALWAVAALAALLARPVAVTLHRRR
jgi:hypothetical protein